jgi:3-phosphoinositide dependent protein kinase-1
MNEKKVLALMDHRNIIKMYAAFQDQYSLYYILELAPGGELFDLVQSRGSLGLELSRFYTVCFYYSYYYC